MRRPMLVAPLAFATIVSLTGCTTQRIVKAYPGPDRPADEVATVTVANPRMFADEKHTVYILAIDGVLVQEKSLIRERIVTALVKPGRHTVAFGFDDGNSRSTTPTVLQLDAEAGKTYEVHAADAGSFGKRFLAALTTRGQWHGWITERGTARVVAGAAPD